MSPDRSPSSSRKPAAPASSKSQASKSAASRSTASKSTASKSTTAESTASKSTAAESTASKSSASKAGAAPAAAAGSGGGGSKVTGSGRTAAERRARAQAMRQAEIRKQRRRRWLVIAAVVVVVAGGVTGIVLGVTSGGGKAKTSASGEELPAFITSSDGATTTEQAVVTVADDSGIDGVMAWNTAGYPASSTGDQTTAVEHQHVTGPVKYAVTPPIGGPHNGVWMNAGVYVQPVPTERAVHDMEHGAVWITYRPSLSAADVATLTAFVAKQTMIPEQSESAVSGQENRYVVMSPWADASLPSAIVISAWGHQLRVDSASDPRLQQFIDTFRHNQKYTPEFGAAVDGVPTGTGGIPASNGSLKANPSGTAS